ncbi:MAG: IclR family transcriptional regulator [Planctomycetaceae bacterium]|nr:IclR family transcriptional regulator [Planctomycetaceae bacterium]
MKRTLEKRDKRALQVPMLERGLAVLEYLAQHDGGATIAELSAALGVASASVFRITRALVKLGYLARNAETKKFSPTRKLLAMGSPGGGDRTLVECALEPMRKLRNATGETTQLCCLADAEMVILEQLLATHPFKYSADLGARCPAYSCAPGKAMFALLPADELDALLERIRFKRFTPTTITSRTAMQRELEAVRTTGYAVDRAEGLVGVHCVAAAIVDRHGYPIAALTISGPESRVPESAFARIGEQVVAAARATSECFNA